MKTTRWVGSRDAWSLVFISIIVLLFFLPFFFPKPKLLVTPDFGKSDAWHFSFATKYLLWESLHQGKLPIWTDKIGAGFPIFAEGQIGTFFLPNLIIYRLTPDPVTAYNLSLVVTILTLGWGMYVWLRVLKISAFPSLFGALTFTLSGIVMLQLPHISLLAGFSLLPWIMMLTQRILASPSPKTIALLAFTISQQIFAGFPQSAFITLLASGALVLWHLWTKEAKRQHLFVYIGALILGFSAGAIQLIASWEFLKEAGIIGGLPPQLASYFSFPLAHLKSFVDPFALGDPKIGTYPHFAKFDGSIFWENTGYIGLLPLILLLIALRFRTSLTSFLLFLLIVSFLLMWGSHSPLYIIYAIWPFNLFRAPSRFLWIFVFALTTLAAMGLQTMLRVTGKKHLIATALLVLVNTGQLFFLWRTYHLLRPGQVWLGKPVIATLIPNDARILTIGAEKTYNTFLGSSGWQKPESYEALRSSLAPDSNIVWGIAQQGVYAGRTLRRPSIFDALITSHIHIGDSGATISTIAQKLLDLMGITHIVSTIPLIPEEGLQKPVVYDERLPNSSDFLRLSVNTSAIARAYLAHTVTSVRTVEEAVAALTKNNFEPGKTVLVEKPLELPEFKGGSVTLTQTGPRRVAVSTESSTAALLVLSDTYYPGWNAYLDHDRVSILPANVQYRGIVVPKGTHSVEFVYEPTSFKIGAAISLCSYLVILILMVSGGVPVLSQTRPISRSLVFHRRSRGRPRPHRG